MFSYCPHVSHFLLPIACFASGQFALGTSWRLFGIAMYVLGAFIAFCIGYAIVKDSQWQHSGAKEDEEGDQSYLRPGADDDATVRVEVWETPSRTTYFDLPATRQQLEVLAASLVNGGTFSERRWTGRMRPFSISQFRTLRDVMLERKIIEQANDKDPRQGYVLTLAGRAMMKRFLPSPTLQGLDALQETG